MLVWSSAPIWAGIDVQVRGLGSDESDNVYAQIGILDYAKKIDAEKAAPKAAEKNQPSKDPTEPPVEYDPEEIQRQFKSGEVDIRTALRPFGWYNPVIKSELRGSNPDWIATYTIDAGPETDVSQVDIQLTGAGHDEPKLKRLVERLQRQVGERLKHEQYADAKQRLLQTAYSLGYLDADLTRHELRVDSDANQAQFLMVLETGERYYFGEVSIEQDGRLKDSLLRRYLTFKPGQHFDPAKVLSTQFAFSDLDYFKLVEVDARKENAGPDHHVPVTIHTSSKLSRAYKYGLGYGTDTGARALAGVEFRRLNEEGHKLSLELRPSQNISSAIAQYKIPFGTLPGENIDFTAEGLQQNFEDIRETLYSFGTGYTQLGGRWQRHYYLTYTNDRYSLPDDPQNTSTLLTPGITISRTSANDPIFPRRGWYAFLDVHGATTADQISDTDFIETLVKLRGVYPLARKLRLLARIEEGATFVSGFNNLPPSQRFFAGGDDSVRGYAYRSLGPKDAQGQVIGGRYLTTGSLELDYDVWREYGIAVFADSGGADDVPDVELHTGAGFGLRYRAPFGAVAVDLAHPFDRGESPVRLHLGVRVGL